MKIAIDCDGVLANFQRAFYHTANSIWPGRVDESYEPKEWDDLGGLGKEDMDVVWKKVVATSNWWLTLDAYTGNVGALAVFLHSERDHDIYIVTSRAITEGKTVAAQTELWLKACGVSGTMHNYLGIIAVEDWHDKAKIYKAMQFDMSLDDKAETVEQCDKLANHRAYLLDRPWNQKANVQRRVKTVAEYLDDARRKV